MTRKYKIMNLLQVRMLESVCVETILMYLLSVLLCFNEVVGLSGFTVARHVTELR
jgi:hypothetical protein